MYDSSEFLAQHIHIGQVTDGASGDSRRLGNGLPHIAGIGIGEREVVTVRQILLPDHHRIAGPCIGIPLGIDNGVFGQISLKRKGLIVVGVGVPSSEGVTKAGGVFGFVVLQLVSNLLGNLIRLQEFRGGIGGTLCDFVERQPVAVGDVHHKHEVSLDEERVFILVQIKRIRPIHYVSVASHQLPTVEIIVDIFRHIVLVDDVWTNVCGIPGIENVINTDHNPWVVKASVIDIVGAQTHGKEL